MNAGEHRADPLALEMRDIAKSYGEVHALRGVDFQLRRGEVMALLGENGAGKSTLVKIIAGMTSADAGSISVDGKSNMLGTPRRSAAAGIAVAEQELSVIGPLSAAENIFLGGVPFSGPWTRKSLADRAEPFLEAVGLGHIDANTAVENLSVAERQLVEIARLLARDAQILVLDEPTAALSDTEITRVKEMVSRLARDGKSIVYVTHRLGEVFEIADRITTLRGGRNDQPMRVGDTNVEEVIERMIGRPLEDMFPPRSTRSGPVVLEVRDVTTAELPEPQSLTVHSGEIIGIAGQLGSGAGALLRAIAGADIVTCGQIHVRGRPLERAHSPQSAKRAGIAYCSSDRKLDGIFAGLSVSQNLVSTAMSSITRRGVVIRRRTEKLATSISQQVALSPNQANYAVGNLSGGNQQKVALGKWLGIDPLVLLVHEPTRGVDVGARAEIYQHLRRLADGGLAIVFASSDLDEVQGLCDRVITMYRGRQVRSTHPEKVSSTELLRDITHPEEVAVR